MWLRRAVQRFSLDNKSIWNPSGNGRVFGHLMKPFSTSSKDDDHSSMNQVDGADDDSMSNPEKFDWADPNLSDDMLLKHLFDSTDLEATLGKKPLRPGDIYDPLSVIQSNDPTMFGQRRQRQVYKPSRLLRTGFEIHHTNLWFLSRFISPLGKIMPRRRTGLSAKKQRALSKAIRRARNMGILPFLYRYNDGLLATLDNEAKPNLLAGPQREVRAHHQGVASPAGANPAGASSETSTSASGSERQ